MFFVETAVAATLLCTANKRQCSEIESLSVVNSKHGTSLFKVSSGRTLEGKMVNDIQDMAGVVDVTVKRTGDTFDVFVVMENMEFEPFDRVVNCKLALYDRYPNYTFHFDYQLEDASPAIASYAA